MKTPDWKAVRKEFPALKGRVFLNTATYGQLPRRATEAVSQHFRRRDERACSDFLSWFDDMDVLRQSIAKWIRATADDIAFVTTASHALSIVMEGIVWREGDEIVTLEDEFPNQVYAAQSRFGIHGVVASWYRIEEAISPKTRLILLSTVNYQTGLRPDVEAIIPTLRERGVLVYLDGTQSVGALCMDCSVLAPDFLAVDAYKWMISPNGAGFLYVRPAVREWLRPNVIGWRSDQSWRSVEALHGGAPRFKASAEKYEGGMLAFPSLIGMQSSLSLLEEIGRERIESRVLQLADYVRDRFLSMGAEEFRAMPNSLRTQICLLKIPGVDSSALAQGLGEQRVHISARREYLRISPHFYNDEDDINALADAVRSHLR